jgi:hypothetical protein
VILPDPGSTSELAHPANDSSHQRKLPMDLGRLPVPSWQTVGMGRRADPRQTIWEQGPNAFAFLLKEWGFEGPERTDEGIAYHRPDLHVTVERWAWKNEAGFTTEVRGMDRRTGAQHWASLGCLYVACGLGPLQHVPETVGGGHTISKRIAQHAGALRRVMPYLNGPTVAELLRRCQGRLLPDDQAPSA